MIEAPVKPRLYIPRRVEFFDTTLRDGLQSPEWQYTGKMSPSIEERLEIVEGLIQYGVRFIEVFSPVVSGMERKSLGAVVKKRDEVHKRTGQRAYIIVHARCNQRDVDAAMGYNVDGFNFYMGTSQQSQRYNHGKPLVEVARTSLSLIQDLRRTYPDLLIRFSGEDSFRTSLENLFRVYDRLEGLVDRFGIPDTVGVGKLKTVRERVLALRERYPRIPLEGHFHDDTQLAVANALDAIEEGVQYMDTTILGVAERSGLPSMTALALNLSETSDELFVGYNRHLSYPLNIKLADIIGIDVPTKEPVSLTNKTHTGGVHQRAVLRNPTVYEAHRLEDWGVTDREILLGPLSGKHEIHYYLTKIFYFTGVTDAKTDAITAEYKERTGRPNQDAQKLLWGIARRHGLRPTKKRTYIEHLQNERKK